MVRHRALPAAMARGGALRCAAGGDGSHGSVAGRTLFLPYQSVFGRLRIFYSTVFIYRISAGARVSLRPHRRFFFSTSIHRS